MAFLETPRFPLSPAFGLIGGPEYKTGIVPLNSGFEQRNADWSISRSRYQLQYPLVGADKDTFLSWFHAMAGRFTGFRLQDPSDSSVTLASGRVGTSPTGVGTATSQLNKVYAAGAIERYRKIRKPEYLQPIQLYRGGVLQAVGIDYALDTTTGIVTWSADASSSATSITPGTTTRVVLGSNLGMTSGLLYLSGFSGAGAVFVNGLAHTINSVTGTTFTLATNTAGQTITLGAGVGAKYAQVSETLAWTGNYDIPVRFDADYAGLTMEYKNLWRAESFQLIEIRT